MLGLLPRQRLVYTDGDAATEGVPGVEVEVAATEARVGADHEVETEAGPGPVTVATGAGQMTGAEVEPAAAVAVVGAGAVAEAEDSAKVEAAAAGVGAGAEMEAAAAGAGDVVGDWRLGVGVNPGEECWWAVLDSSIEETMDGSARLEEALKAFSRSVKVAGLRGDGQLLPELEDVSGGKGWRLSVVRLRKRGEVLQVQAVCVVSKARGIARRGKVYRMQALAVKEGQRGRGLAAEALRRLQVELGELAGADYRMVTNMAACMAKEGVGFYGSQGWTGGSGVWEWDSRAAPSRGSKGN